MRASAHPTVRLEIEATQQDNGAASWDAGMIKVFVIDLGTIQLRVNPTATVVKVAGGRLIEDLVLEAKRQSRS